MIGLDIKNRDSNAAFPGICIAGYPNIPLLSAVKKNIIA